MHFALAALFAGAILTLWIPAVWPVSAFEIAIYALCVIALWRRTPSRVPYPCIPLALAVVWGVVQLQFHLTVYPFDTQVATLRWAAFLASFLTGVCLFADQSVQAWFRSAMLWFGFVLSIVATLQTFTSPGKIFWIFPTEYTENVMGPILYHTHWAVFVEVILPIAVYEALRREQDGLLYAGMAGALYASVIASASRAGAALVTGEILVVGLLMAMRGFSTGRTVGFVLLRVVALVAVFTAIAGWGHLWNRLRQPDPMQLRREFNVASVRIIRDHPFTGTGLGTWPTVYPKYAVIDGGAFANQAHNDWAQFTAEGGLFFGLAVLSIFLWSLRPAFQTIWGLGVVAVFLHAFIDYPFSRPALGSWPILVLAMLAASATGAKSSAGEQVAAS